MISANGGLPAHRYTPQVTPRWPRGSEPASVAQGLELRFDLAMMVHIVADLHELGSSLPLGPIVAALTVPLQPLHEAADNGQAWLLGAGNGVWL